MREQASVMHLDLDAFFASVEQRDKPSLRGKPVVVGGVGGRGVVATASYEARAFGVRSAMSTREARALCPHAAFLSPRFAAYQSASAAVMDVLTSLSPLVEPLSLDEAYVDLAAADLPDLETRTVRALAEQARRQVHQATGGLTASVGLASSKFLAKIASEVNKPDGLTVVPPGTEMDLLLPLDVRVIPGVGPATNERLRRLGVHTVAELQAVSLAELVRVVGNAHGHSLHAFARGEDARRVEPRRGAKSISAEGTFDVDLTDRRLLEGLLTRQANEVSARLRKQSLSGRTVTVKVRLRDFTTLARSQSLASPVDDSRAIARTARTLLADIDVSSGVRLLGVGVSGLADWVQEELFASAPCDEQAPLAPIEAPRARWTPGADVAHDTYGPGWVWGSGRRVVTVRFETAQTPPGPVRSFAVDDPTLRPRPLPPEGSERPPQ